MKILVTGSKGFVGKNLIAELRNRGYLDILEYDIDSEKYLLKEYTRCCDFVFHLAGIEQAREEKSYIKCNFDSTERLTKLLIHNNNAVPILYISSSRASEDNSYGRSKRGAEVLLFNYEDDTGIGVYIYRLPIILKRSNHNGKESIIDEEWKVCYIDDVIQEFIRAVEADVERKNRYIEYTNK